VSRGLPYSFVNGVFALPKGESAFSRNRGGIRLKSSENGGKRIGPPYSLAGKRIDPP
jgi:hypothetical protein